MQRAMLGVVAAAIWVSPAWAESNVVLYGRFDTMVRYSNHEAAGGAKLLQLADGWRFPSYWGIRGSEDIGGGTRVTFNLESPFRPDTGAATQSNRLFGRLADLGVEGGLGSLHAGRTYTFAHEYLARSTSMVLGNNGATTIASAYGNARHDNQLKYTKAWGPVTAGVSYTFGEVAGATTQKSARGAVLAFTQGSFNAYAVYQVGRDVSGSTTNFQVPYYSFLPAALASKQEVMLIGADYKGQSFKVSGAFINNVLDVADYKNRYFTGELRYNVGAALDLTTNIQYDMLDHAGRTGKRIITAVMAEYYLSKRTTGYLVVERNQLNGEWIDLGARVSGAGNFYGHDSRNAVSVGIRHTF